MSRIQLLSIIKTNKMKLKNLIVILFLLIISTVKSQITYVDSAAIGANNGTNWTNAYTDLQAALTNTSFGEIWVAKGTYSPTITSSSTIYFNLKNNVAIYGGFNGNETNLHQRDYNIYTTILSGDIGNSNRSYHVVYGDNVDSTAILDGFTITRGKADQQGFPGYFGGGIYLKYSSPKIKNCIVIDNTALKRGGGIHSHYGSPLIYNCLITNNSHTGSGNSTGGGGISSYSSYMNIEKSSISNNFPEGIYASNYSSLTIDSSSISNNSVYGIRLDDSNLNLFNSSIDSSVIGLLGEGYSEVLIEGCNFFQNFNYGFQNDDSYGKYEFYNSSFIKNGTGSLHGGLRIVSETTIDNCTFFKNANTGLVLSSYNNINNKKINNCTIDSNYIGISMVNGTLSNCTITNNTQTGIDSYELGLNPIGLTTIKDCIISNNGDSLSPNDGGGINVSGDVQIKNCLVENNTALEGAGIRLNNGSPTITNCTFKNNKGWSGTGIYIRNLPSNANDSISIINCSFINNRSSGAGAGITSTTDGQLFITNSIFHSNTSSQEGTSLYLTNSTAKIVNSTFYANHYDGTCSGCGSEISGGGPSLNITNSILWNTSNNTLNRGEIYFLGGATNYSYSNIKGGYPGLGNLNVDPMFVDTTNFDLRLHCNSPLINIGTNDSIPNNLHTDFSGNNRIHDSIIDLGAYETGNTDIKTSICYGDSILIYGNYQSVTNTYYDSLSTTYGCDSVIATQLFVNSIDSSSSNQIVFQGDSVLVYGNYQNTAGIYYDSLININGCDSIASTTLSVNTCSASANYTYLNNGAGNYSFTNSPSGNLPESHWAFGDGTTSNTTNPNHTFTVNGTFVVVLTINDTSAVGSCLDYFMDTITVTSVPSPLQCTSGFVMYPDTTLGNVIVINSSTGNNLTYSWTFGDGNTSTLQNPSHTYASSGPFYLCLTINDGNSCIDTYCSLIGQNGVWFKQGGFTINVIGTPIITELDNHPELNSDINIYPIPTSNQLTINTELKLSEITIIDITGKIIMRTKGNTNTINVADLSDGIYFIQLITGERTITKKFVKQ
jgi:hypothetical protein